MRSTYLKSLREEAKKRLTAASEPKIVPKKIRVPRDFTYDYNTSVLNRHQLDRKYTARSPLKYPMVDIE